MESLSESQREAVGEIVNLGIGLGAAALSRMTDDEIVLTVPKVELVPRDEAACALVDDPAKRLTAIRQEFCGGFGGQALLLFPEERTLQLARSLLGEAIELDAMTELEENALLEVGNIVLNACLSAFADSLDVQLQTKLPTLLRGTREELLASGQADEEGVVALLCIHFALRFQAIGGFATFALDVGSIRRLKEHVDAYLAKLLH